MQEDSLEIKFIHLFDDPIPRIFHSDSIKMSIILSFVKLLWWSFGVRLNELSIYSLSWIYRNFWGQFSEFVQMCDLKDLKKEEHTDDCNEKLSANTIIFLTTETSVHACIRWINAFYTKSIYRI